MMKIIEFGRAFEVEMIASHSTKGKYQQVVVLTKEMEEESKHGWEEDELTREYIRVEEQKMTGKKCISSAHRELDWYRY